MADPMAASDWEQGPKRVAEGTAGGTGMVAAAHPLVAEAMADVLRDGGNAMDAVLTAVVLQAVVEPQMTSLAGGLSVLYRQADNDTYHYLDAELDHTRAGAKVAGSWAQWDTLEAGLGETSGKRVGVPGVVAGVAEAAQRFGSLPWPRYFEPAIAAASEGTPMSSFLYGETAAAAGRLAAYPSGRAEFLPDGYVPPVGTVLRRARLAATLADIARLGPDHVYRGAFARSFVDAVRGCGGDLDADDLTDYRVRVVEPLRTEIAGNELIGAPPPSTGGVMIALITRLAAALDLGRMGHYREDVEALRSLRQAVAFAEHLSEGYVRDPVGQGVATEALHAPALVDALAELITGAAVVDRNDGGGPLPPPGAAATSRDPHACDTDHVVAIDAAGNTASMTHTIYGTTFGTGLVVEGVPVNSGNTFPGARRGAGRRAVSPFPPTILARNGRPELVLGSPGLAARAVALVLVNHLEYGLDLRTAIDAPRFQGAQVDQPCTIEARVEPHVLADLSARYGVDVRPCTPYNWHFGAVAAIADVGGELRGFVDPRRPGRAVAG